MKIAILTSGRLPVPAVKGGAVETLIDFCLEYNNIHKLHDITIYSVNHPLAVSHKSCSSSNNHYYFINTSSFLSKILTKIYRIFNYKRYYDNTNEYFLKRIISNIKKNKFDILIIENRPGYVLKLKGKTNARLIIHQENDYLNHKSYRCKDIYHAASLIINTSDFITKRVRTINHDDKKCITVLNGIDTERFYNAEPIKRQSIGINSEDFVIVYSGRLTPEKGVLQLVQAIKRINTIQHLKLLVIGASFYGQDKHQTSFSKHLLIETDAIKEKILFTGFVEYAQIPSYLKLADIAIVPSIWEEPFGLTVVEAMAAGLPLITTRSGGIPEICEGIAIIVDRENIVDNLTTAILDLYEHPGKRKLMARASLEHSKLFDKRIYAKNFFAAIE